VSTKSNHESRTMQTNLPFTVYRFDRLRFPGDTPKNEEPVSHHLTFGEAAEEANNIRRNDRIYSYGVGMN
jgi:hypothetical protein